MSSGGRIDAFDGLRTVAVMAVLLAHFGWFIAPAGYEGVDVFFVLSGFLITGLLEREYAATRSIALRRFYLRRLLRLYPALLVAVLLCAALGRGVYADRSDFFSETFLSLTYLMDIARSAGWVAPDRAGPLAVTWSLAIEEHFYLAWPLVFLFLRRRHSARVVGAVGIGIAAASFAALVVATAAGQDPLRLYFRPDLRCGGLFVGCALALVRLPIPDRVMRLAMPLSLIALIASMQVPGSNASMSAFGVRLPLVWLTTCLVIEGCGRLDGSLARRALSIPPAVAVGRISYGVYLFHLPIISVLTAARFSVRFLGSVFLPIGIAAVSFIVVEKPFLTLKDKIGQASRDDEARTPPPHSAEPFP
jgi:peptidoglycan/LPS O-acetylase OafA/YrhL